MPRLKEIMAALEQLAPSFLAEKWDHVGLMVGHPEQKVQKVLCALDLNEEVIWEAVKEGAQCIVTHHPFLFKPVSSVDLSTIQGKMIKLLLDHEISVYAMHTNYDIAWGGLNDYLAQGLGLKHIKVLSPTYEENFYKVVVYVPRTHVEQVRAVILKMNETRLGDYKGCTFAAEGKSTFIPLAGSQPFIGQIDKVSYADETAISFMATRQEAMQCIKAIEEVHPYEEMAWDLLPLTNCKKVYGIGRYGQLEEAVPLKVYLQQIKAYFNIDYLKISTMQQDKMIQKIAICSGAGSDFIGAASKVADLYITGDVKFHEAQYAKAQGLIIVDVGHYASENRALAPIGQCIQKAFPECEVDFSKVNGETLLIQ